MKTILLLPLIIFSLYSFAQTEEKTNNVKKHRIGLNIGAATANGDFSSTDASNENSGFAEAGFTFNISYQYNFDKNFSATFLYGSAAYTFDAQSYVEELANITPTVNWRVEAESYGIGYTMFGLKAFSDGNTKAYINPMIGVGAMITPQVDINASNGINSIDQRIRESDAVLALVFGISGGIDITASDMISINIDVTYLNSNFEVEQELESFDMNGNPIVVRETSDFPYGSILLSAGVGFNF
tara:strand:+ start:363 stop:1088 length:726 start_codon:yes stop_codon:yes gene_type:complete